MSNPMKQHGAFSWNELMTSDLEGAKSFYGAMFNWQMKDLEMESTYTMASVDGEDKAGMMALPPHMPGVPPHWGAYVTVEDVDASAKQAEALGGKVLMPARDIPNVGRFCVIADPQGAVLSMITYFEEAMG